MIAAARAECAPGLHRWNWDVCVLCGAERPAVEKAAKAKALAEALAVVRSAEIELEALSAVGNDYWCRVSISPRGGGWDEMWVNLSAKCLAFRSGKNGPRRCAHGPMCRSVDEARAAILEAHEAASIKFERNRRRER